MTRIQVIGTVSVIVVFLLAIYIWVMPSKEKKPLNLEKIQHDVLAQRETVNEYDKKTWDWISKNSIDADIGFIEPSKTIKQKYSPKQDVVNYFLTGILQKDVDIFISAFKTQVISNDLFRDDNPDKDAVGLVLIDRISRGGTLSGVDYQEDKKAFNSPSNDLTLVFHYKDGLSKKVKVSVTSMENSHSQKEVSEVYVITTSSWNIIEQIESK